MNSLSKCLLVLVISLFNCYTLFAQNNIFVYPLSSFKDLQFEKKIVLLNPSFVELNTSLNETVLTDNIKNQFIMSVQKNVISLTTFLADDNPMTLKMDIINDTLATWSVLTCDCNIGLESSVFSNNSNPYNKQIATVKLNKQGWIDVQYTDNFIKDFLEKTSMSRVFFLPKYRLYKS